jgi:thymidine kinase
MKAITAENIEEVYEKVCQYDVIGIDEGQFVSFGHLFTDIILQFLLLFQFKDLVKYAQDFANAGKTVIIAALNGDYRQQPFNNVTLLMPVAEKIEKLSAVCACGQSASFTFRMNESRKVS